MLDIPKIQELKKNGEIATHMDVSLLQMFDRHTNNLDIAVQATANDYISAIQPSTAAVNHVMLMDLYVGASLFLPFLTSFFIFFFFISSIAQTYKCFYFLGAYFVHPSSKYRNPVVSLC